VTAAKVVNSGTQSAAVFNFVIPAGVAGVEGSNALLIAPLEKVTLMALAATGVIDLNTRSSGIWYFMLPATSNFTVNIRGDATTAFDAMLAVGQSLTVVILITNGITPYYPNVINIDGTKVVPMWSGGMSPSAGDSSSTNSYSFVIIKLAAATFRIFANQTKFA
jgi:hypothetical protein